MERINRARGRLADARWYLRQTECELDEAIMLSSRSAFRFYLWPTLWAIAGAVVIWWGAVNVPTALMDTGGNWGWATVTGGAFLALMAIGGFFDARGKRADAPGNVVSCTKKGAELEQSIVDLTAKVDEEKAEYERRRRQPDAAMTLLGLLGQQAIRQLPEDDDLTAELRGVIEGYSGPEWEALEKRVGVARVAQLRAAQQSLHLSNGGTR